MRRKPRRGRARDKRQVKVTFPDDLARYFQLKHPSKWRKFKEFATTLDKFSKGSQRLLQILLEGDEQDRRVLNSVPLSFLIKNEIKLVVETKDGELITLGGEDHPWSSIETSLAQQGLDDFMNLDPMPNPDDYDSEEDKQIAIAMRSHIEKHSVILKALEVFGGELRGYKPQEKYDDV